MVQVGTPKFNCRVLGRVAGGTSVWLRDKILIIKPISHALTTIFFKKLHYLQEYSFHPNAFS